MTEGLGSANASMPGVRLVTVASRPHRVACPMPTTAGRPLRGSAGVAPRCCQSYALRFRGAVRYLV